VLVNSPPQFSFTLDAWKKVYSTLFGGFHDLSKTAAADETEYDEMEDVPKKRKTREGYLKDGFIVEEPALKKLKQLKGKSKKNNTSLSPPHASASAAASEPQHEEVELEEDPYITDNDTDDAC
jgi:hypothetical protein